LTQHTSYHRNIQQGDELYDDQYRYVYFGRAKRAERVWDSFA
jgi:hypothetical protein